MYSQGQIQIDPESIQSGGSGEVEIVVPYTERRVTSAVLERACELTAGLNARVTLVAVHTIPFPATFACPTAVHAHLVEQLVDLASGCPLPVTPQIVLARGREEGFQSMLPPEATVLIGSRKRFWRTPEENLARALARSGHKVALVHVA